MQLPPLALLLTVAIPGLLSAPALALQASEEGFTLFAPLTSTDTHLLDLDGTIAHTWPSSNPPGNAVYLRPNGNLLRTINTGGGGVGGTGGGLQEIAWDGTLVWDYLPDPAVRRTHHDIEELPNGNILMIAWEDKSKAEAVSAGRKPTLVTSSLFSPDHIFEVQRTGATSGLIVWEWHAWDHLIQDFAPTKANYGVVADHPELIDINYPAVAVSNGDWLHVNGVDYNADFDQIAISIHNTNEIWIIDHSTTTAEAAGHTGGNSGQGGDLLYRWGNPQAYDAGSAADQQLKGQHDVNWIEDGFPGNGNLMIFNNKVGSGSATHSEVYEITPPVDVSGAYPLAPGAAWGPSSTTWSYAAPTPTDFYSSHISGAVRLSNGNTLICSGAQGWLFEVTSAGALVWEYTNALPSPGSNAVFKVRRYDRSLWSFPQELSLSSGGPISLEIQASSEQAGRVYLLLGSAGGTSPAPVIDSHLLPLNPTDSYFLRTLKSPNTAPLSNSLGVLDGSGAASATFTLPAGTDPALAGLELNHAFLVIDPVAGAVTHTSSAAALTLF